MTIPPIISALAVGIAVWLMATAVLVAVIPPNEDLPTVLVVLTYVVGIVAAYLTYRARVQRPD